jgi:pSer/pThr/pTyr-binding forkhead associated (FHA) protein
MSPELLLLIIRILIAAILYVFLGVILLYLWKDMQSHGKVKQISPEAHLEKIEGEALESKYPLEEINLIGRATDNTLILYESTVSGYHARLSYQNEQWWLEDLGSRNGTFVNELPVSEPLVITYGDVLGFGKTRLRLAPGHSPAKDIQQDQKNNTNTSDMHE